MARPTFCNASALMCNSDHGERATRKGAEVEDSKSASVKVFANNARQRKSLKCCGSNRLSGMRTNSRVARSVGRRCSM